LSVLLVGALQMIYVDALPHCWSKRDPSLVHVDVNPQMGTNSVWEWGVPKWEFLTFLYGDHHMETAMPIWKTFHMGIFSSIPKWARTLFGNGLVTEPVPIWKWGRVNPSSEYETRAA
jgi:hypothetical protein